METHTNFKHTPGPWAWQKFGEHYLLVAQHGMREIILSAGTKDYGLPTVGFPAMNNNGVLEPVNPNHPNAKLIAAAPKLLNALISAREALIFEDYNPNHSLIESIDAIIKKATE